MKFNSFSANTVEMLQYSDFSFEKELPSRNKSVSNPQLAGTAPKLITFLQLSLDTKDETNLSISCRQLDILPT